MAAFHSRSNSFPSNAHPFIPEIKEQLNRINSSKAASSSSSEIYQNLGSLQDLHDSIDKLLTQKAFGKEQNNQCVDELLDGSLRLLDLCSTAKDALMLTEESLLELQSTIRRKTGGQETEIKKYLASRKTVKKIIKRALENMKGMRKNKTNQETSATVSMLREIEATAISVLESLLSLVMGSKQSSWSLFSKVMHKKRVSYEEEETENEFEKVDAALHSTSKSENLQDKLRDLEICVQDLEESLESLNRRLIKTRVSLLNIFNH